MRFKYKKMIAIGLSILAISNTPITFAATQPTNLTLKDAQLLLTKNSVVLMDLDQGVRSFKDAEKKAAEGKQKIEGYYYEYQNFVKMYENGVASNPLSEATYGMYQAMFGKEPTKSYKDIYNQFINTIEITHYDLYQRKEIMKIDRTITEATLNYNLEKIFNSLGSLDQTIRVNSLYISSLEKKQAELNLQYKLGKVSRFEKEKAELELSKSKLNADSLQRTRDNLEMNLRSMVGISADQQIVYKYDQANTLGTLKTLPSYQIALRNENLKLKKALIDVRTIEREIGIMKEYIKDEQDEQRMDAEQRLTSAELNYMSVENALKTDLQKSYGQTLSKQKQLEVANRKLTESKAMLTKVKSYFKVGYVKKLDVISAEIGVTQAEIDVKKLQNELVESLDLINQVVLNGVEAN